MAPSFAPPGLRRASAGRAQGREKGGLRRRQRHGVHLGAEGLLRLGQEGVVDVHQQVEAVGEEDDLVGDGVVVPHREAEDAAHEEAVAVPQRGRPRQGPPGRDPEPEGDDAGRPLEGDLLRGPVRA